MNSIDRLSGDVKGKVNSAIQDALGTIIQGNYISNVTWDSATHTLSFYSGSTLVYSCVVELGIRDDVNKPLYLLSTQNGSTVALNKIGNTHTDTYQTSTDGSTWANYTFGDVITLNDGEGIYFRISADRQTTFTSTLYVHFTTTGGFEAYHNVNSLLSPNFGNLTNLTTVVGSGAYCLNSLFEGYNNSTVISKAPLLPATTLALYCYSYMFYSCTSLTTAPALPATALANYCYKQMFDGCTSLTTAPILPAATLTNYCYDGMFNGCRQLREVHISATDISATSCLTLWLDGVSATGDFYCNPNTSFPSGPSGKPAGWTRHPLT